MAWVAGQKPGSLELRALYRTCVDGRTLVRTDQVIMRTLPGDCRILSYINNAHPVKRGALYQVVEKILAKRFPYGEAP
jgi:hypothetical protein